MHFAHGRSCAVSFFLCAALAIANASGALRASQRPPGSGGPAVTIDFRALADDGQPVADLKAADVSLKIDGRAREIRSLELIQLGQGKGAAGAPPPPFGSNAPSDAGRDVLLVIEDESITPGKEQQLRDAVDQLMNALSPRDRVGLRSVPRGGSSVGSTTDFASIRAAMAAFTGRAPRIETATEVACRTRLTLDALKALLVAASSELPTTIVFFSGSLAPPVLDRTARIGADSGLCQIRTEDFDEMGAYARASHVSFYVVHAMESTSYLASASEQAAGLESLVGVSNGDLVRLTGNTQIAMTRVARETSAYYLVRFDPDPSERNGASHRVDVRIGRDHVKLRARAEVTIAKVRTSPANPRDMIREGRIHRDLPLRAAGYASRNPGDDKVKIVALFEPLDPSVTLSSAMIGLFDDKGKLTAQWTAQGAELARAPVMSALVASPGRYRLRVAAVDASGRGGTADYELNAQIVRADPISLSALVLGAAQGGAFAAKLHFGSADQAAVGYFEIYGGAKIASLSTTLELAQSDAGPALATAVATISPPNSQDARSAHAGFSIAALAPGDYVVRAIVSIDGKEVGRVARTLRKGT